MRDGLKRGLVLNPLEGQRKREVITPAGTKNACKFPHMRGR